MAESCLISVLLQTPLQTHSHRDGSQCNPGMFPASIQESGAGDSLDLEFSSSVLLFFFCSNWKPLCNVVPGEVGSEGPGGHKLEKIKSFRSCLLTGAIAVMFYSSQPTDKCAQVRGRSETASKRD